MLGDLRGADPYALMLERPERWSDGSAAGTSRGEETAAVVGTAFGESVPVEQSLTP